MFASGAVGLRSARRLGRANRRGRSWRVHFRKLVDALVAAISQTADRHAADGLPKKLISVRVNAASLAGITFVSGRALGNGWPNWLRLGWCLDHELLKALIVLVLQAANRHAKVALAQRSVLVRIYAARLSRVAVISLLATGRHHRFRARGRRIDRLKFFHAQVIADCEAAEIKSFKGSSIQPTVGLVDAADRFIRATIGGLHTARDVRSDRSVRLILNLKRLNALLAEHGQATNRQSVDVHSIHSTIVLNDAAGVLWEFETHAVILGLAKRVSWHVRLRRRWFRDVCRLVLSETNGTIGQAADLHAGERDALVSVDVLELAASFPALAVSSGSTLIDRCGGRLRVILRPDVLAVLVRRLHAAKGLLSDDLEDLLPQPAVDGDLMLLDVFAAV